MTHSYLHANVEMVFWYFRSNMSRWPTFTSWCSCIALRFDRLSKNLRRLPSIFVNNLDIVQWTFNFRQESLTTLVLFTQVYRIIEERCEFSNGFDLIETSPQILIERRSEFYQRNVFKVANTTRPFTVKWWYKKKTFATL